jgi:hypothetical protein
MTVNEMTMNLFGLGAKTTSAAQTTSGDYASAPAQSADASGFEDLLGGLTGGAKRAGGGGGPLGGIMSMVTAPLNLIFGLFGGLFGGGHHAKGGAGAADGALGGIMSGGGKDAGGMHGLFGGRHGHHGGGFDAASGAGQCDMHGSAPQKDSSFDAGAPQKFTATPTTVTMTAPTTDTSSDLPPLLPVEATTDMPTPTTTTSTPVVAPSTDTTASTSADTSSVDAPGIASSAGAATAPPAADTTVV